MSKWLFCPRTLCQNYFLKILNAHFPLPSADSLSQLIEKLSFPQKNLPLLPGNYVPPFLLVPWATPCGEAHSDMLLLLLDSHYKAVFLFHLFHIISQFPKCFGPFTLTRSMHTALSTCSVLLRGSITPDVLWSPT